MKRILKSKATMKILFAIIFIITSYYLYNIPPDCTADGVLCFNKYAIYGLFCLMIAGVFLGSFILTLIQKWWSGLN